MAAALTYALLVTWVCAIVVAVLAAAGVNARDSTLPVWALAVGVGAGVLSAVPLQGWLRPRVDGVLFSHPHDAAELMVQLGRRFGGEPGPDGAAGGTEAVTAQIAAQIAGRLRLPYAAIVTEDEAAPDGPSGPPNRSRLVRVPLSFSGERVGTLLVEPRARDRVLPGPDAELLADLAAQIGIALHAARALDQVRASRAAVITAREEERRRIRRDLHDGLAPTLASLRLHLAALEQLIPDRPGDAVDLATRLRSEVRHASAGIRDLVYDLRPPALDELGLLPAIRSRAEDLHSQSGVEVQVIAGGEDADGLDGSGSLPEFPAATEVALYRIACEALTNVGRHAGASCLCLRMMADGEQVTLTVDDDGRGLPKPLMPGVGLTGMRERAEELGGVLVTGQRPGGPGTRIAVTLPLRRGAAGLRDDGMQAW